MYSKIINDIRTLKIQGAVNVAVKAVEAFDEKLEELYDEHKDIKEFIKNLKTVKNELFSLRPTEPALRNSLKYIFSNIEYTLNMEELKKKMKTNIRSVKEHFLKSKEAIFKIGSKRIRKGMTIFTHCHASTVTGILIKAKNLGIDFKVHNTETRPLFQGRITAEELAKNNIEVEHYVDSAGRLALKKADIMLIGSDAILSDGTVINKIGSEMFAEIAQRYDIPVYVCTDSWKFDPETIFGFDETIEIRKEDEIWKNAPKKVHINNFAFEKINPNLITGIISELGIFKPDVFIEEVLEVYPWMKNKVKI